MTAIVRGLSGAVGHRPVTAVCAAVVATVVLGHWAAERPLEVQGLFVVPLLVAGALRLFRRGFASLPNGEWLIRLATIGLFLRLGYVMLHLAIGFWFYGGGVDFVDFHRVARDLLSALLQGQDYDFGFVSDDSGGLRGMGVGNLATFGLLTMLAAVTGPSLLGMFPACAVLGAIGAYLFLRAYQTVFPDAVEARFLPRAVFLLPAAGFWATYLGKDSLAFFLLGWATFALAHLLAARRVRHVAALAASIVLLMGVRPHIAVAVVLGAGLALALQPLERRGPVGYLRPVKRVALVGALAAGVAYATGEGLIQGGLREITLEVLAERAYTQQRGFVTTEAASALAPTIESSDPGEVVSAIPFGVFTLLFRPLPWEAHNVLAIAAAAENVVLLALVVWRWRSILGVLAAPLRHPFMLYALITLVLGAAALSFNWNLGTLARHRTMVVPFLLIVLAGPGRRPRPRPGPVDV